MKSFDVMILEGELGFRGYSEATIKIYARALEEFLEYENKESDKITIKDVKAYFKYLTERFSNSTAIIKQTAISFWFSTVKSGNIKLGVIKREKYKRVMLLESEIDLLIIGNENKIRSEMWGNVCKFGTTAQELSEVYGIPIREIGRYLHRDLKKAGIQKRVSVFGLKASMAKILMDKGDKEKAARLIGNGDVAKLESYFKRIRVLAELL